MIRIDPFFHGAQRKTELVGKPINFDLGHRGHFFCWSQKQPRELGEALLRFHASVVPPAWGAKKA